jgi:uncharacterized membrane protein YphA (DoxX/SURF4 family)
MKIASTVCRYLLGLMFAIFGSNGFFHFIKQPPPSTGFAGQFLGVAFESHFMVPIFALQLICGILLLADYLAPLAIVILAGVLTNILIFHITMDPAGAPPGIVATILWFFTAQNYRANFRGIFLPKAIAGPG